MIPKTPDDGQQYTELSKPLIAFVNPKEGVLVNDTADRETERQWRDKVFPKQFSSEWLEGIKQDLKINDLPKEFFEPLYASDLSVLAYQLAVEKYEGRSLQSPDQNEEPYWQTRGSSARPLLSENDLSSVPIIEIAGIGIVNFETEIKLLHYTKGGTMTSFSPGKEGFDLVLASHYGRRVPFMCFDYPEIVGDGKINQAGIYTEPDSGTLMIKFSLGPKKESSVEQQEGKADE